MILQSAFLVLSVVKSCGLKEIVIPQVLLFIIDLLFEVAKIPLLNQSVSFQY
jgi:hypothetical protein